MMKQLVLNHTKGQGHTWDLNSDLLMSHSVHAPLALVFLTPRFPPSPSAQRVSATLDLSQLPAMLVVASSVSPQGTCHPIEYVPKSLEETKLHLARQWCGQFEHFFEKLVRMRIKITRFLEKL